jgi:serine-type D-Ala-D-Ala carboxypeptidase/endopeptidase (penicillin-binding protein 4)
MRSLAERVSAKSGTMNYADGLVGFFTTHSGRQLGFAILLTDFRRRASLDATFDVRIPAAPPDSHGWTKRAKKLERALVSDWLARY